MAFQKGQSGNPGGRPSPARTQLDTLLGRVFTAAKRKQVLSRLITDAIDGQHEARVLLLAYTYGKPIERTEIDQGGTIRFIVEYADPASPDPAARGAAPDLTDGEAL